MSYKIGKNWNKINKIGSGQNRRNTDVESGLPNQRLMEGSELLCTCRRPEMLPPGTLVHIVPMDIKDEKDVTKKSTDKKRKNHKYLLKVEGVTKFRDIKISPNMIEDHYPQAYIKSLNNLHNYPIS